MSPVGTEHGLTKKERMDVERPEQGAPLTRDSELRSLWQPYSFRHHSPNLSKGKVEP